MFCKTSCNTTNVVEPTVFTIFLTVFIFHNFFHFCPHHPSLPHSPTHPQPSNLVVPSPPKPSKQFSTPPTPLTLTYAVLCLMTVAVFLFIISPKCPITLLFRINQINMTLKDAYLSVCRCVIWPVFS